MLALKKAVSIVRGLSNKGQRYTVNYGKTRARLAKNSFVKIKELTAARVREMTEGGITGF